MDFLRAIGNDLGLEMAQQDGSGGSAGPASGSAGSGGDSSGEKQQQREEEDAHEAKENAGPSAFGSWNLAKTMGQFASLAVKKSEEMLEDYSRDLAEFQSTLGMEVKGGVEAASASLPELATKAAEAGSSAQQQFEHLGENIERLGSNVLKSTTELLSSVTEAIEAVEDEEGQLQKSKYRRPMKLGDGASGSAKYNRFEAQVAAMQRDSSTYCDEPEDEEDYEAWRQEFRVEEREDEVEKIVTGNTFMQELQSRIVPDIVEYETFWSRYFYRLHKLQQAQEAREDLVKRAALQAEEELSWDVDDGEDEEEAGNTTATGQSPEPQQLHEQEQVGQDTLGTESMLSAEEQEEAHDELTEATAADPTDMAAAAAAAAAAQESAMQQEAEDQTVSSETSRSSSDWTMVSESTARAASVVSLQTEDDSLGNESAVEVREGEEGDVDEDWGSWE